MYGNSMESYGIYGVTGSASNNYGVYTPDNLYSLNYHLKGAIMQVVLNGGDTPLEVGDVVVFSGISQPDSADGEPVIEVSKATAANSAAVAGVVFSRYENDNTVEGAAQPGEYLLVVVQGPARVKVSAGSGSIQPGDLLSSAGDAGYAARAAQVEIQGASTTIPGTILGKALETLDSGTGWIYIFVTLK
jgi:hypothetical protein